MKILLTSPYPVLPANSGGAVRTVNIAQALASLGHQVHLLSASQIMNDESYPDIHFHAFRDTGTVGHFFNRDFSKKLDALLNQGFDLLIAGFPYQAWMLVPAAKRHRIPLVYDAHNVEADRFRKMGRPLVATLIRLAERRLSRAANMVLTVSEQDRELMQMVHGVDSLLLANGVNTRSMRPLGDNASPETPLDSPYVLFFGGFDYPPNIEAARFLLEEVWPEAREAIPTIKLALVGRHPHDWMQGHEGVIVTGGVDDIVSVIQHAKVVVAPLFSGGGTRLKIVEALACGKDILATPFGAMGIADKDSPALHLAEPKQFARRLVELVKENDELSPINSLARELAGRYDWQTLVQKAEQQLLSLTSQSQN